MPRKLECDSCGSVVIKRDFSFDDNHRFEFSLPGDSRGDGPGPLPQEYHHYEHTLCTECIRKIVDWIDDADETETRVELLDLEIAADGLSVQAEELADLAESLDELSQGEVD